MLIDTQCITLTDDNFEFEVLKARTPVLVDCWASWCGSFQPIDPILEATTIEFAGRIKTGRLNVAASERLAAQYGIRAVPTLLLFKDGQVLERTIGSVSIALANTLNATLSASAVLPVSNLNRSQIACL